MELAGLEPATSWVRFRRGRLPYLVVAIHLPHKRETGRNGFAVDFRASSRLLDHGLTTTSTPAHGGHPQVSRRHAADLAYSPTRFVQSDRRTSSRAHTVYVVTPVVPRAPPPAPSPTRRQESRAPRRVRRASRSLPDECRLGDRARCFAQASPTSTTYWTSTRRSAPGTRARNTRR